MSGAVYRPYLPSVIVVNKLGVINWRLAHKKFDHDEDIFEHTLYLDYFEIREQIVLLTVFQTDLKRLLDVRTLPSAGNTQSL